MSSAYVAHRQGVYLVHLSERLHHAGHYLGWSWDVDNRLDQHWAGRGANFLRVCKELGLTWELVRVWPGAPRLLEQIFKARHNGRLLCPYCNPTGPLGTDCYITGELWPELVLPKSITSRSYPEPIPSLACF